MWSGCTCIGYATAKKTFLPDKNHIHHKLLAIGMQQHTAMITIVSALGMFILFNILLSLCLDVNEFCRATSDMDSRQHFADESDRAVSVKTDY